eukprot:12504887-Heterocapsa_arctica.AAC.1
MGTWPPNCRIVAQMGGSAQGSSTGSWIPKWLRQGMGRGNRSWTKERVHGRPTTPRTSMGSNRKQELREEAQEARGMEGPAERLQ